MSTKRWLVASPLPETALAGLAAYPPIVAQILYNRHIETGPEAERFFAGQLAHPGDPTELTGLPQAVDRLQRAVRAGERIVVYGDYDTDGVTAAALLVQVLRAMGGEAHDYIPLREEEGYGLNVEAMHKLKAQSTGVVVSVDCGVRSIAEAEAARNLGLDLIITDHHQPGDELPPAFAIINPKQPGDDYPEKGLAGVGLAYKLAQGLIRPLAQRPIAGSDVLDLVALGTVADLAPLTGENRVLVRQGLAMINRGRRTGLKALLDVSRLRLGQVDASAIGYSLGPRLNAAGRLESAQAAYRLLTTSANEEALELALRLEAQNRERQELTRWTQARARELALTTYGDGALLFAADPEFKPGVVGLAAARLTEEFYRPTVVATRGPEETRGSCRSIPEFHITNALDRCAALLIRHGGHAAAAGFTVRSEDVETLAATLKNIAQETLGEMDLHPTQRVDVDHVRLADLDRELADYLRQFEPCGFENPTPVLASRGVKVANSRPVGADGKHLKLTLTDGRLTFDAIAFGQAPAHAQLPAYVDAAYCLEWNEWNGERRLQLNVKNMQKSS